MKLIPLVILASIAGLSFVHAAPLPAEGQSTSPVEEAADPDALCIVALGSAMGRTEVRQNEQMSAAVLDALYFRRGRVGRLYPGRALGPALLVADREFPADRWAGRAGACLDEQGGAMRSLGAALRAAAENSPDSRLPQVDRNDQLSDDFDLKCLAI